jgi:CubicO group peptidase (beta-lactamase class C family)
MMNARVGRLGKGTFRALFGYLALVVVGALAATDVAQAQLVTHAVEEAYWPGPRGDWERRAPEAVGMDGARVQQAIAALTAPERNGVPKDVAQWLRVNFSAREPFGEIIGPVKDHDGPAGVILRHGYIVAEWGDPHRVDMTFSVSKSFVSVMWGLAYDDGLITDVHDRVADYVPDGTFDGPRNSRITWDMLLRKTSEWEGALFGIPTWSDRFAGEIRELQEPGTFYEYNDVRVNLLSYALMHTWRQPLPQVLQERVMGPIGATGWQWHGYDNSWVDLDGRQVQSVSGGGHWGGGVWISARDQARFGLLHLRNGRWKDRQILSQAYLDMATTPGTLNQGGFGNYGMPGRRAQAPANGPSAGAITHSGAGPNMIFVDPHYDLVIVTRWSNNQGFVQQIIDAVDPTTVSASARD